MRENKDCKFLTKAEKNGKCHVIIIAYVPTNEQPKKAEQTQHKASQFVNIKINKEGKTLLLKTKQNGKLSLQK